jgi:hypothetical protein
MIEEEPEWITYDQWGAFLPEAPLGYQMSIGAENFEKILETYGGREAVDDWNMLASKLRPSRPASRAYFTRRLGRMRGTVNGRGQVSDVIR